MSKSKSREVALAEKSDVSTFVREAKETCLRQYDPPHLLTELELLAKVNRGFPETFWNRY